jgi:hypothetical protein
MLPGPWVTPTPGSSATGCGSRNCRRACLSPFWQARPLPPSTSNDQCDCRVYDRFLRPGVQQAEASQWSSLEQRGASRGGRGGQPADGLAARVKIATSRLTAQQVLELPTRYGVLDNNGGSGSASLQRLRLDAKGACWGLVDQLMGTLQGYGRVRHRMKVGPRHAHPLLGVVGCISSLTMVQGRHAGAGLPSTRFSCPSILSLNCFPLRSPTLTWASLWSLP